MKISSSFDFVYEHTIKKVMHPKQHIFDIYSLDKTKKFMQLNKIIIGLKFILRLFSEFKPLMNDIKSC